MEEQKLLKKKKKAVGNNSSLVSACTDLAEYYASHGKYSKAIREFEIVANIYKGENKLIPYAQAHRGIGEAYMGLNQFENALKHFKIYYDVANSTNVVLEQQRALAQTGHLYLTWFLETITENNRSLLEDAYCYFMKSMKKCDSLNDNLEKQDMLARLFSNLGIVKEHLGEYEIAKSLYERSIKLCLKHDLYDQLYRGYMAMASLLEKQSSYQETIKNYNLAEECAKKLGEKSVEFLCAAMLAKSEVFIKLADFNGAKQVLRRAYNLKTPSQQERKVIEHHLRVVAALCYTEDQVIMCSDDNQLKVLYEKLGDGACDLKNFSKAIEYYKKMLEVAQRSGASNKELGECYFSLGETFKDNEQYREAEFYYEKEYRLCEDNLKDSLNTLSKIADLKELAGDRVGEVKKVYERALGNCKSKGSLVEEKRMLVRYVDYLRRFDCHVDAFKLETRLSELREIEGGKEETSSSDNESEDSELKAHVGEDIVLSDITDVSGDDSDNDQSTKPTTNRQMNKRRRANVKFKKNLNGEWPLHVACIQGNLKRVQYWLDVDHPVNVRDNAGWLPLHEAAVHGHLDIVRLLLDHKAAINDRGGAECNGITPLLDAASNGHLEVVELLLDRGASAVAKTDDGSTALNELQKWRERASSELNDEEKTSFNKVAKRLSDALDKVGEKCDDFKVKNRAQDKENVCLGNLRRRLDTSGDEVVHQDDEPPHSLADEYQQVMKTLRHKSYGKPTGKGSPAKKKVGLLDAEEDLSDDWLEDDTKPTRSKKRRLDDAEKVWRRERSSGSVRSAGSQSRSAQLVRHTSYGSCSMSPAKSILDGPFEVEDTSDNFFIADADVQPVAYVDPTERRRSNESKRRTQTSLLESGFSKSRVSISPSSNPSSQRSSSFDRSQQRKLTSFGHTRIVVEADSTTSRTPTKAREGADLTLFVDVEIERRLFRVPVLFSQVQSRTIRWLAEEAAQRYASKEFMKPSLELETVNGAILADDDMLGLLFPMGNVQAEKVVARVVDWTLPSLAQRYKESCAHMGADIDEDVCELLDRVSIGLDLSDRGLTSKNVTPLVKALSHQSTLAALNLSGNFIDMQATRALCASLVTLRSLRVLNLSCAGIRSAEVSILRRCVCENDFPNLSELELSDNPLGSDSVEHLAAISTRLKLSALNVSNAGLGATPTDAEFDLKLLRRLDVSNNELGVDDIKKLVSACDPSRLTRLDVSNNRAAGVLRGIVESFAPAKVVALERVNLNRCGVTDSDLFGLLRLAPRLTDVDLLYNSDLTSISLRRLLERGAMKRINLIGCAGVWKYFEDAADWSIGFGTGGGDKMLKMSAEGGERRDALVRVITEKCPRCVVEISACSLCLKM